MKFKAICNLKKSTPSGAEDASYRLSRSHLNQKVSPGYEIGDVFDYVYSSDSGLWLKDKQNVIVFVPTGEVQCFSEID
jgi:hypothetical protein